MSRDVVIKHLHPALFMSWVQYRRLTVNRVTTEYSRPRHGAQYTFDAGRKARIHELGGWAFARLECASHVLLRCIWI
jgi:hypothetical protein